MTWTAVDTATGYTVQWTSGSQGYNTGDRQAPVTSGSTTRYTIPSLINGTAYTVRVIATRRPTDERILPVTAVKCDNDILLRQAEVGCE